MSLFLQTFIPSYHYSSISNLTFTWFSLSLFFFWKKGLCQNSQWPLPKKVPMKFTNTCPKKCEFVFIDVIKFEMGLEWVLPKFQWHIFYTYPWKFRISSHTLNYWYIKGLISNLGWSHPPWWRVWCCYANGDGLTVVMPVVLTRLVMAWSMLMEVGAAMDMDTIAGVIALRLIHSIPAIMVP